MTYAEKFKEVFGYYPECMPCPDKCPKGRQNQSCIDGSECEYFSDFREKEYKEKGEGEESEHNEIDDFVTFLIRENCDGCNECEPRISVDWSHKLACVEEGRAKWLLAMSEKYKAESEEK